MGRLLGHFRLDLGAHVGVAQQLCKHRGALREVLGRHALAQPRLRGGVGVLVQRDAHAAVDGLVDEAQRLPRRAPVALAAHLVVRDDQRHVRGLCDGDGLSDGLDYVVGLAAHVRGVDAAVGADDLAQLDELLDVGIDAGHVDEPGAQAQAAVLHRVAQARLHQRQLIGGGLAVGAPHHRHAQHAVPLQEGVVARLGLGVGVRQKGAKVAEALDVLEVLRAHLLGEKAADLGVVRVGHGKGRGAALPRDLGGDALRDLAHREHLRIQADEAVVVRMAVDEPGGERQPCRVDHGARLVAGVECDLAVQYAHVAHIGGRARAVDDAGVADDEVQHVCQPPSG